MPDPIADQIQDRFFSHAIDLLRIEAGLRKRALAMLKRLETSLVADLTKNDPTSVRTAYRQARLKALLEQTRATIATSYRDMNGWLQGELFDVAQEESAFVLRAVNEPVGVSLASVAVETDTLRSLARNTLIQGSASKDWWSWQSRTLQKRFADQMREGILRGESLGPLVQRVRGTRAKGFTDGIMQKSRREAEALVRSSVQAVLNEARNETYARNDDVIKAVQWLSTLDTRTTILCQVRDRKLYTLDHKPIGHSIPWNAGPGKLHWSCRSTSLPVLKSYRELSRRDAVQTGGRPTSARQYIEKRLRDQGFDDEQIAKLVENTRSSMDGLVPNELSYPQWLRKKDAAEPGFAKKVLGPTRYGLWRSGKLPFDKLVDQSGNELTVKQLKVRQS